MKNKNFIIFFISICIVSSIFIVISMQYNMNKTYNEFELKWQNTTKRAFNIKYYDEVLTMSSKMASYTRDLDWIKRYNDHVILLDKELLEVSKINSEIKPIIKNIYEANNELVYLEKKSFECVVNYNFKDAQAILNSDEYEENKLIYSQAIDDIIKYLTSENEKMLSYVNKYFNKVNFIMIAILLLIIILVIYLINILKNHSQELYNISILDPLLNIANRRHLDSLLEYEIQRAKRYNSTFSIIMFDIDFFKKINDTYGHKMGDKILKELTQFIKNKIRTSDILGRWGGEEFLIIIPETNLEKAVNVAQNLRKAVEEKVFVNNIKITLSFGVTEYKNSLKSNELFDNVDKAMYEAKKTGRNKVNYL